MRGTAFLVVGSFYSLLRLVMRGFFVVGLRICH